MALTDCLSIGRYLCGGMIPIDFSSKNIFRNTKLQAEAIIMQRANGSIPSSSFLDVICTKICLNSSLQNINLRSGKMAFVHIANDGIAVVPSKGMTKNTWCYDILRKQPFTKFLTCARALEYSIFVLVNVTEAMLVDFVFVNAFFAHFMKDTIQV